MTAFDAAWDLLKLMMMPQSSEQEEEIVEIALDSGDDECCSRFGPALEELGFKGTCQEMYDALTEIVEAIERSPWAGKVKDSKNPLVQMKDIYRQWNECKAKNNFFGGME